LGGAEDGHVPINSQFFLDSRSKLYFIGDSTFHSFEVQATELSLYSKIQSTTPIRLEDLIEKGPREFNLRINVGGLRSESDGLNEKMYEILDSKKHPSIDFSLKTYKAKISNTSQKIYKVNAYGSLKLQNVEKSIELLADAEISGESIHLTGKKDLLMSEFGISPPSFIFISTNDKISVYFDFFLKLDSSTLQ
jgi:hypothetical protein